MEHDIIVFEGTGKLKEDISAEKEALKNEKRIFPITNT